jgi:hypothetical protein
MEDVEMKRIIGPGPKHPRTVCGRNRSHVILRGRNAMKRSETVTVLWSFHQSEVGDRLRIAKGLHAAG